MKWNLFPLNIGIEDSTALLDKKVFFITFLYVFLLWIQLLYINCNLEWCLFFVKVREHVCAQISLPSGRLTRH